MAVIASLPSTTASVTITIASWWLKDPLDASADLAVNVNSPKNHIGEQSGTFYPLGATFPVVVADAINGDDGTIEMLSLTDAEYKALMVLLRKQRVLLLQSPYGEQWYVRFNVPRERELMPSSAGSPYRKYTASYVEVAAP